MTLKTEIREVGRVLMYDDSNRPHSVIVQAEFTKEIYLDGKESAPEPGLKSYWLRDGQKLSPQKDGTYLNQATGDVLRTAK